jgi:hypothetical protein
VLIDPALAWLDEEKTDLEGVALGRRQALECLKRELVQEISQPGVGERSLGWDRLAGEDAKTSLARERNSLSPERGLTDARLSIEDEAGGLRAGAIAEVPEGS